MTERGLYHVLYTPLSVFRPPYGIPDPRSDDDELGKCCGLVGPYFHDSRPSFSAMPLASIPSLPQIGNLAIAVVAERVGHVDVDGSRPIEKRTRIM